MYWTCPHCNEISSKSHKSRHIATFHPQHKETKPANFSKGDVVCPQCNELMDRKHLHRHIKAIHKGFLRPNQTVKDLIARILKLGRDNEKFVSNKPIQVPVSWSITSIFLNKLWSEKGNVQQRDVISMAFQIGKMVAQDGFIDMRQYNVWDFIELLVSQAYVSKQDKLCSLAVPSGDDEPSQIKYIRIKCLSKGPMWATMIKQINGSVALHRLMVKIMKSELKFLKNVPTIKEKIDFRENNVPQIVGVAQWKTKLPYAPKSRPLPFGLTMKDSEQSEEEIWEQQEEIQEEK